jgi:hypothetical protein
MIQGGASVACQPMWSHKGNLMKSLSLSKRAAAVAVIGLLTVAMTPLCGQEPGTEPPARLKGTWQFNKALSKLPPEAPSGRGTDGPGGRAGGRAGARGGPPPDPETARAAAAAENTPEMRQIRAAMREVQPPPETLFISASPTEVTFTSNDGTTRQFTSDGVKQRMEFSSARVEATTTWTPAGLSQELVAGPLKLARTWVVSDDGSRLVITARAEATARPGPAVPMILVYDRAK